MKAVLFDTVTVVVSTLSALAISGLIMYPVHDRTWAPWARAALSMGLGAAIATLITRGRRTTR